jgi:hypothetical protein
VGQELLAKYVFIHLSEPADKLQLMLAMLHKLYALVRAQRVCVGVWVGVCVRGGGVRGRAAGGWMVHEWLVWQPLLY